MVNTKGWACVELPVDIFSWDRGWGKCRRNLEQRWQNFLYWRHEVPNEILLRELHPNEANCSSWTESKRFRIVDGASPHIFQERSGLRNIVGIETSRGEESTSFNPKFFYNCEIYRFYVLIPFWWKKFFLHQYDHSDRWGLSERLANSQYSWDLDAWFN